MAKKIFSRYNLPPSPAVKFAPGSSLTRQEFAADSDINRLVARYSETGFFYDPVTEAKASARIPQFGDFTSVPDYQEACNLVIDAQQRFAALPSSVRERFNNDPAQLLAFIDNPDNLDEAVKLGLLPKPDEPALPAVPESPAEPAK